MVHASVEYVVQKFRDKKIEDSRFDKYNKLSIFLQQQYKGY